MPQPNTTFVLDNPTQIWYNVCIRVERKNIIPTIPYRDWPEEKKEQSRQASRNWAARNDRSLYYKDYEITKRSVEKKKLRADKFRNYRNNNPEKFRLYSNEAYHRNKNNDRPSTKREYKIWWSARKRATSKSIPFDIERCDVIIPEVCPCCKQSMNRPSLDKVIPELGYVKGNIAVICLDCNVIKSYGTAERHRQIADFIDNFIL